MNLVQLVYISDAAVKFSDRDLFELNRGACANNEKLGITGLLLFSGGHFMQILEGEDLFVTSLYFKIAQDSRHNNALQLVCKQANSRLFPTWGMGLINTNESAVLDRERIDKVLIRLRLSQGDSASQAIELLKEFRNQFKLPAA